MAYKYTFERAQIDIVPGDNVTAMVYCLIRDNAGVGKLAEKQLDKIQFVVSFPITAIGFRNQAVAAITGRYPGATTE